MALSDYRLFNKDGEIIVIGDELELRILELLSEFEKSFSDLLKNLNVPKSTLSLKLDHLKSSHVVAEVSVPEDKRKKVFRLNGHLVSKRAKPQKQTEEHAITRLAADLENSQNYMSAVFRSMRCMLCETGVADQKLLGNMGKKIGDEIAKTIPGSDADSVLRGIDRFLQDNKLGKIKIMSKNPLTFEIEEFDDCKDVEGSGRHFCAFDEGIFQSVFDTKLNKRTFVKELRDSLKHAGHTKYVVVFE